MDDQAILTRIEALVSEEHKLQADERERAVSEEALAADRDRLQAVSLELDRCWDLLRQRRALRDAGASPDQAEARDPDTVERYLQ
ncbi:MAG: hypothetical protein QOK19_2298 [Solirubrobacteraceae bacterium]|jgi:hypothetical protein|nr:hypothetical protein [Solirubrobacterales bacterium]MEA2216737.1 hypothetical protein [Solirubrobacteraceae bacterium]